MAIHSHGDRLVDADTTGLKNLAMVSAAAGVGVYAALIRPMAEAKRNMQVAKCYGCVIAGLLAAVFIFKLLSRLPMFRGRAAAFSESFKRLLLTIAAFSIPAWAVLFSLDMFTEYQISMGTGGYIALMLGSATLGALIMHGVGRVPRGLERALLILSILLSCALLLVHSFFPNIVNGRFNDVHHYSAVNQTIFNVAFDEPFTLESSATYGHYSLFMWPILKLFGHKPIVITLIYAACFLITEAAFIALVCRLTKHDLLRAAAILGSSIMCLWPIEMSPLNRLGYFPLRLMCHMLMLVYIFYGYEGRWYRNSPRRYYITGYILGALAITWQIDFGVSATLAFTVSIWIRQWQRERVFSGSSLWVYGLSLLGCLGSAAGTVVLINLYNLIVSGGPLVFRECFFPLLGGESFVSGISRSLDFFGECWLVPPAFFMVSVMLGLLSVRSLKVTKTDRTALAICGTMGLAEYAYLFNVIYQAWVGVMCCITLCFVQLIEMALSVKDYKTSFLNAVRHGTGAGAAVFLGMFLVIFAVRGPEMVRERAELGIASMDSMEKLAAQVENSVPRDTYAVGYYTQDVYAYLGWDPGYHKRDPANFFGQGAERSLEYIAKQDTVLAGKLSEHMFTEDMDFVITKMIPEEDEFFYYMEKFLPVATVLDAEDITLEASGDVQLARLSVELRGNTMYEIEVVVSDETGPDVSGLDAALLAGETEFIQSAAQSHTWDFVKNTVPQGEYSEEE